MASPCTQGSLIYLSSAIHWSKGEGHRWPSFPHNLEDNPQVADMGWRGGYFKEYVAWLCDCVKSCLKSVVPLGELIEVVVTILINTALISWVVLGLITSLGLPSFSGVSLINPRHFQRVHRICFYPFLYRLMVTLQPKSRPFSSAKATCWQWPSSLL